MEIVLAQNELSVVAYRGDVVMKYKIIYSQDFDSFVAEINFGLDDGWKPLGNPSIQIEEYIKNVEGGREYWRATQFRFHQAMTKEGEDNESG
jgi:hypothetical protein